MIPLLNPHHLSKSQKQELFASLGGKYKLWDRIRGGGIGLAGLFLRVEENQSLPLRFPQASESIRVAFEMLKNGIILGFNNTKEVKWYIAADPKIQIRMRALPSTQQKRTPLYIELRINDDEFILRNEGWNNPAILSYFSKLNKAFAPKVTFEYIKGS